METFYCPQILLPEGWAENRVIAVDDEGSVSAVRQGIPADAKTEIHGTVVPGMPNLHSHAFQRAMAGLTESRTGTADSFWSWRSRMFSFLEVLNPDDVEAIASQLYIEMLKAGYTSVGEFHYLHHNPDGDAYENPAEMSLKILSAAEISGIGLTHLPVLYCYGGFGAVEPSGKQRRFLHDADTFLKLLENLSPLFPGYPNRRLGMAPHSLRAVTPELLNEVIPSFRVMLPEAPLHIHVAEQTTEVEDCLKWSGRRPVQWLFENHEPDSCWCLVHATHLDQGEREALGSSAALVGLCPTTEANLGDGFFPLQDFLGEGGSFGIGSDSHVSVSVSEELRWLEYQQRLLVNQRNILAVNSEKSTGRELFDMALRGGSRALGRKAGDIAEGFRADWVVLDTKHPLLYGKTGDSLLDSWIFSGNVPVIRDVYVGGREVVSEGIHVEEDRIEEAFLQTMKRILC